MDNRRSRRRSGVVFVGLQIALVAKYEVVGGATNRGGVVVAAVANLVTHVFEGESVGGVNLLVAEQA